MKTIKLKRLELKNFKGIKYLKIDFSEQTDIFGENGTGKTTIQDAFRWLLFDKDSTNRKDFEIKTLDKDNQVIHNLEHCVIGTLLINAKQKTFEKIYKENWTKKRGSAESVFSGHETLYSIDDVPFKKSEYQEAITDLLEEELFKMITDPLYFSDKVKWENRRPILIEMAGDVSVSDIIASDRSLSPLAELLEDKDITDARKSIAARRKKLNDEIKSIPYRIDELNNSFLKVDATESNILSDIDKLKTEIVEVDKQIIGLSDYNRENGLQELLRTKMNEVAQLERDAKNLRIAEIDVIKDQIRDLNSNISTSKATLTSYERVNEGQRKDIDKLQQRILALRDSFAKESGKAFVFDASLAECPTCKRAFDSNVVESKKAELLANFNKNKAHELSEIQIAGKEFAKDLEAAKEMLVKDELEVSVLGKKIQPMELDVFDKKELLLKKEQAEIVYPETRAILLVDIAELQQKINNYVETDTAELHDKKVSLNDSLDKAKGMLHNLESNKTTASRVKELSEQEKELSQQIADLEKQDFLCENFIKAKVGMLEEKINSLFKFVNFKLFETQINGGIIETCVALVDGVPFSDANNAAKYNAGLDIINTLSTYYNVSAPIFIDNRESINEIINVGTDPQIINLIVSKDKELRIENKLNKKVA